MPERHHAVVAIVTNPTRTRGVVLDREQLRGTPLIWGLGPIVAAYLERPGEP